MRDGTRSRLARAGVRFRHIAVWVVVIAVVSAILCIGLYQGTQSRGEFVYQAHLDDTAVTIDGEKLTFRDLAFYVVYEENQVQKAALIYDQQRPLDYWNSHASGFFVVSGARKAAMEMAIHDRILLGMADKEGVTLSTDEKKKLEDRKADFYEDLYDEQKENLPVSRAVLDKAMDHIAISEKYQIMLADEHEDTFASYGYDGRAYLRIRKKHKVKIQDNWNRIRIGRITLNNNSSFDKGQESQ